MSNQVTSFNLTQLAGLIQATPRALEQALESLPGDAWRWHPAPEEWCINEVLGHVIEADRRGFHGRIQAILAHDRPQLEPWDMNAVAAGRRDCERDGRDLLAELGARRDESAKLVAGLEPEQLERTGRHPQVGELRVIDLLYEWIHHDHNHVKQILSNVQAAVWPKMGNAQRFSEID